MDVYGKAPTTEAGEHFRNSGSWWYPLAEYCCEVAPEISGRCNDWDPKDGEEGEGLDAEGARALAQALEEELSSGRTAAYATTRRTALDAVPDIACFICWGGGWRAQPPVGGPGEFLCNGCKGTGLMRPLETDCPFTVQHVREFVVFLKSCGGFDLCP